MGLDRSFVKAKETGLFVSAAAPAGARASRPTPVTITVASGGAEAGTLSLPVEALSTALKANQVLVFNEGEDEVELVVTEDAESGATQLSVDAVDGEEGDGIPGDLTAGDVAEWDGMYRVLGTQASPYSLQDNTQNLQSVTYDTGGMVWDESEDLSKAWQIAREGRFKPHDYAFQQVQAAAHEGREVWVKQVLPDEEGKPVMTREGRAKVRNYAESNPADGIYDASWQFAGQGKPITTRLS